MKTAPTTAEPAAEPSDAQTLSFLNVTRGHDLRGQAGRLTLAQVAEMLDAIGGIRVVCHHVIEWGGYAITPEDRYGRALAGLTIRLSLARAREILTRWHAWTHPLGSLNCPIRSEAARGYVVGFLHELSASMARVS